jgi:hypothetical protein
MLRRHAIARKVPLGGAGVRGDGDGGGELVFSLGVAASELEGELVVADRPGKSHSGEGRLL